MIIRDEAAGDDAAIRAVNLAAFETDTEARLVDLLRVTASPVISLVAEVAGDVVGHIMFSPVVVDGCGDLLLLGLAPMAVSPAYQRQGIGSALVRAGLDACRTLGACAVVVLGHPAYYPRFGFRPASELGLACEYDVPAGFFMARALGPGHLEGVRGTVRYHRAFGEV